ncbi:MAG: EAL domain-containing protein [Rhodocyclaceae bacterium]|nr:EAL domain-containing protein [Rhodocyclaceae bacterium]
MLRDRGVRISTDDFGTGYSSLNYLRRFPINSIKLGQSFVRDLDENHRHSPIVNAIPALPTASRTRKLLAEGVEPDFSAAPCRTLVAMSAGLPAQRPLPASEARACSRDDVLVA